MIECIGQNICVMKLEEKKQIGGLDLGRQETDDLRYIKGEIISVGNDVPVLKAGQIIYFDKTRAHTMIEDGQRYTFTSYPSVVCCL